MASGAAISIIRRTCCSRLATVTRRRLRRTAPKTRSTDERGGEAKRSKARSRLRERRGAQDRRSCPRVLAAADAQTLGFARTSKEAARRRAIRGGRHGHAANCEAGHGGRSMTFFTFTFYVFAASRAAAADGQQYQGARLAVIRRLRLSVRNRRGGFARCDHRRDRIDAPQAHGDEIPGSGVAGESAAAGSRAPRPYASGKNEDLTGDAKRRREEQGQRCRY